MQRRLRDIATEAAFGHHDDTDTTPGHPSQSLFKPHIACADPSGDAQSVRIGNKSSITHGEHALDLNMSWKTQRARSHSAPASHSAAPASHSGATQNSTERHKRSVLGASGLEQASLSVLDKGYTASGGSGKSGKDSRKSSKNKRVRSARRALPAAAGTPEGAANAAWLDGGLPLEGMWALEVEGLDFSDSESVPAGARSSQLDSWLRSIVRVGCSGSQCNNRRLCSVM